MNPRAPSTIYKGKRISVEEIPFKTKEGKLKIYEVVRHPKACAILPILDEKYILLISQYRAACQKHFLEVPAGIIEDKEDPLMAAQRELQEEVGYNAKRWHFFGQIFPSPGIMDEEIHFFVAKDLFKSKLPHDEDEEIEALRLPFSEALKRIDLGQIVDAKTISLLLKYERLKDTLHV